MTRLMRVAPTSRNNWASKHNKTIGRKTIIGQTGTCGALTQCGFLYWQLVCLHIRQTASNGSTRIERKRSVLFLVHLWKILFLELKRPFTTQWSSVPTASVHILPQNLNNISASCYNCSVTGWRHQQRDIVVRGLHIQARGVCVVSWQHKGLISHSANARAKWHKYGFCVSQRSLTNWRLLVNMGAVATAVGISFS